VELVGIKRVEKERSNSITLQKAPALPTIEDDSPVSEDDKIALSSDNVPDNILTNNFL
jgi:hypothetical protein